MAVIFQPGLQAVFVADFAQTAYVIIGHLVRDETAQIPQETVGYILTLHHDTIQRRQERNRVVAVAFLEIIKERICVILTSHFIAVLHHKCPALAVLRGNAAKDFTHERIKVRRHMFAAHLIHFQTGGFFAGRRIFDTSRLGTNAHHFPISGGCVPFQLVAGKVFADVQHLGTVHHLGDVIRGWLDFPLIFVPVRKRFLKHLGQTLLRITLDRGQCAQLDLGQPDIAGIVHYQTIVSAPCRRNRNDDRRQRCKTHIQSGIITIQFELGQGRISSVRLFHLERSTGIDIVIVSVDLDRPNHFRLGQGQIHRDITIFIRGQLGTAGRISINQLGTVFQFRRSRDPFQRSFILRQYRISQHFHVLIIAFGLAEDDTDRFAAGHFCAVECQIAHRLFRLDPRAAGLTPAG